MSAPFAWGTRKATSRLRSPTRANAWTRRRSRSLARRERLSRFCAGQPRWVGINIAQFVRMGIPPVRRAFVILLVAAGIVALLLMFAQDQETLKIRSAVSAEDTRHPPYIAALVGA